MVIPRDAHSNTMQTHRSIAHRPPLSVGSLSSSRPPTDTSSEAVGSGQAGRSGVVVRTTGAGGWRRWGALLCILPGAVCGRVVHVRRRRDLCVRRCVHGSGDRRRPLSDTPQCCRADANAVAHSDRSSDPHARSLNSTRPHIITAQRSVVQRRQLTHSAVQRRPKPARRHTAPTSPARGGHRAHSQLNDPSSRTSPIIMTCISTFPLALTLRH